MEVAEVEVEEVELEEEVEVEGEETEEAEEVEVAEEVGWGASGVRRAVAHVAVGRLHGALRDVAQPAHEALRGTGGGVGARGARPALGGHPLAVELAARAGRALHGALG